VVHLGVVRLGLPRVALGQVGPVILERPARSGFVPLVGAGVRSLGGAGCLEEDSAPSAPWHFTPKTIVEDDEGGYAWHCLADPAHGPIRLTPDEIQGLVRQEAEAIAWYEKSRVAP